jgi:hypothetical protein
LNSGFVSVIVAGITPFIILTLLIAGVSLHTVAWQPPALWTEVLGKGTHNVVVVADNNGVYAGGVAGANLFLSRYDMGGQRLWKQYFGNSTTDSIYGVALGTDGVYVAGTLFNMDFITKYDPSGNALWAKTFGGLYYPTLSAGAGDVFVSFYDKTSNSTLLRAYDSNGNTLWTDSLEYGSIIHMSTHSRDSRVYVIGYKGSNYLGSFDFQGNSNWGKNLTCSCEPVDLAADASGIYVAGTTYLGGLTASGVLIKYDVTGNMIWTRIYDAPGGIGVQNPQISIDTTGIYLAMATYRSSTSGLLVRYDDNGNQVWSIEIPVSADAVSIGQNSVYVGGTSSSAELLAKYDQSSSLVLFGVNPPFSFGLVGLLAGVVALSVLWFRRQRRRQIRRPKSSVPYSSKKSREDDAKWMKRQP